MALLVSEPDILLLDEPNNHLDIPAIEWLEEQLHAFAGALITHDRRFLQNVATSMPELDRGRLTQWQGDYQGLLRHREEQLAAEEPTSVPSPRGKAVKTDPPRTSTSVRMSQSATASSSWRVISTAHLKNPVW